MPTLIAKAQSLHEEGESHAKDLVADVERAQASAEAEAIPIMLALEKTLLDTAEKLELIDFTQRKQLERIRDDRHLLASGAIRLDITSGLPLDQASLAHATLQAGANIGKTLLAVSP